MENNVYHMPHYVKKKQCVCTHPWACTVQGLSPTIEDLDVGAGKGRLNRPQSRLLFGLKAKSERNLPSSHLVHPSHPEEIT